MGVNDINSSANLNNATPVGGDAAPTPAPEAAPAQATTSAPAADSGLQNLAFTSALTVSDENNAVDQTDPSDQTDQADQTSESEKTKSSILDLADRAKSGDKGALKQLVQVTQAQADAAEIFSQNILAQDSSEETSGNKKEEGKETDQVYREAFDQANFVKDQAVKTRAQAQTTAAQTNPTNIDTLVEQATQLRQASQKLVQQQNKAQQQAQGNETRDASKAFQKLMSGGGKSGGEEVKGQNEGQPTNLLLNTGTGLVAPKGSQPKAPPAPPAQTAKTTKSDLSDKSDKSDPSKKKLAVTTEPQTKGADKAEKKEEKQVANREDHRLARPTDKEVAKAAVVVAGTVSPAVRQERKEAAQKVRDKIELAKLKKVEADGEQAEAKPGDALIKSAEQLVVEDQYRKSHSQGFDDLMTGFKTLAGFVPMGLAAGNSEKVHTTLSAKYGSKEFDKNQEALASLVKNPRGQFASSLEGPGVMAYWKNWAPDKNEERASTYLTRQAGQGGAVV